MRTNDHGHRGSGQEGTTSARPSAKRPLKKESFFTPEQEKAAAEAMAILKKARANAKKNHNLTERQLIREINATLDEVRKQHAQRSR